MKRTRIIAPDFSEYPAPFHDILKRAVLYDSSCSPEARVIFLDLDGGYYLKRASAGSLKGEAQMAAYFQKKGLGAAVLDYHTDQRYDWLLTTRVSGEDCTHAQYLADPKRLTDTIAVHLRALHELDFSDCPVQDRTRTYLETAEIGYRAGRCDFSLFGEKIQFESAKEAWRTVEENKHFLKNDVLLHGDYCLPNIMLSDWKFSGFIDLGNGGVGDRHIDLFWGAWTLWFNLKTDQYRARFFDAYGRDKIEMEMLRVIAAAEMFG